MSWNSSAREMSPCERAGSQHLEWRGDAPDPGGTVGSPSQQLTAPITAGSSPRPRAATFLLGTPRAARRVGVSPAWAGMWLPAARMELLMAAASPRALDTVPSQQPACGDQISLHPAGLSCGVPHQHGGAGRQRLTVTCARCPAPRGPPLLIVGHLISTLLTPKLAKG